MNHAPEIVQIQKLLNNGDGLARRGNGEIVFVPNGLPGERFQITELTKNKGVARMKTGRRLSDASARTHPPCPHDAHCGGCSLLHLRREAEPRAKVAMLRDALERIGKLEGFEVNIVDFPMKNSRIRGKLHVDRDGHVGFKAYRGGRVAAMDQCLVIPQSIKSVAALLSPWLKTALFRGEIFFATDMHGENPVLELCGRVLHRGSGPPPSLPGLAGLIIKDPNGRVRFERGAAHVAFDWNARRVTLQASQFFQSNPSSWPLFFAWLDAYLVRFRPQTVWDMHAGSGFLGSRPRGLKIYCSEPDAKAHAAGARFLQNENVHWLQATAEEVIKDAMIPLEQLDGILMDPPRSGLSGPIRDWLVQSGPTSLLYFSCDMGSFARDLKVLAPAYQIASPILAMNLNPGTLRLELSAFLERKQS